MQAQFRDQTVLIGVDDMDLFKGIELKLQAVERLLEQHADWRGKLVLVQVTNAPRCARGTVCAAQIDASPCDTPWCTM
jgi:trehalose 6-phosphate synthase/phosphatase